jgi:hypothetical protein
MLNADVCRTCYKDRLSKSFDLMMEKFAFHQGAVAKGYANFTREGELSELSDLVVALRAATEHARELELCGEKLQWISAHRTPHSKFKIKN